MKYSVLASAKKKKLLKKLKTGTVAGVSTLPTRPLTVSVENIRATVTGENFIRDFQYPQTIRNVMRETEIEKFRAFVESLYGAPLDPQAAFGAANEKNYSREGCLRWIYDNKFFNDGQERYEAADDVSFDVRGNFCYRCEMARRMVELRPIAFEAPDASHPYPEFVTDGFTNKNWTWMDEASIGRCTLVSLGEEEPETANGNFICELSPDLFRSLLTMVQATTGYKELREVGTSYLCGSRRVYVTEATPGTIQGQAGDLDYQMDIANSLRELATPRKINDRGAEVSVIVSEINPFMIDDTETSGGYLNECFYAPRLVVNQWSRVIHSMAVRLNFGLGKSSFLFVCPEYAPGTVDYQTVWSLPYFPDNDFYYPAMFYGRSHLSDIILYSVMYLMEGSGNSDGGFSKVVNENPEEFYKICRRGLSPREAEFYRQRLIIHKRNGRIKNYPSMVKAIRNSFFGLSVARR